jgi:hypothetical protein
MHRKLLERKVYRMLFRGTFVLTGDYPRPYIYLNFSLEMQGMR